MALTILDTIIDEEIRIPSTPPDDEHDKAPTAAILAAIDAVTVAADFGTSPDGFPQFAEKLAFVTSTNPVTDYFLGKSDGTLLVGVATTLSVGGNTIFLYSSADDRNIVFGRIGNGATADPAGDIAVVLAVEENVVDGFVDSADMWIGLYYPLVHDGANLVDSADQLDLDELIYLSSTFDTTTEVPFENLDDVPSGNNLFNVIFASDGSDTAQLLITGSKGEVLSTVNVSTTGIGAGSQHIDVGASLRIDLVTGMTQANVDDAPEVNDELNIDYTGRVESKKADFEITQVNPEKGSSRVDIKISAFNAAGALQEGDYLDDAIDADGVPVTILVANVIVRNADGEDITDEVQLIQDGDSVIIRGLDDGTAGNKEDGWQIFFETAGKFDRFLVTNVDLDGVTCDIGNIHVTVIEGGEETEVEELGSHLLFQDDGPLIDASTATVDQLTVDETTLGLDASGDFSGLFDAPDPGADAPASVAYTLGVSSTGVASGLTHTASGNAIFLFYQGLKVVGRAGATAAAAAAGPIAFEISVDAATGDVTLDQVSAVFHTDSNNHDSTSPAMLAGRITLTATVSDSEPDATDDSASATVGIGDRFLFKDDGPAMGLSTDATKPNDLQVKNLPNDAVAGVDSSFYVLSPGADAQKSLSIIGGPDTTGDFRWAYNGSSTSSIIGSYKGTELYRMVLNADGTYTFDMTGALPFTEDRLDVRDIKAGAPDTNSIVVGTLLSSNNIRISAESTVGNGNINESNAFVGVDNGNLDANESLIFTLETGGLTPQPLTFEGLSIGTKSAQGAFYTWVAVSADGNSESTSPAGGEFVAKNGTLVVNPSDLGLLSSIIVTKVSGPATKIGLGNIAILTPPADVVLDFTVRLTDGDNDYADRTFSVSIDGNNDDLITDPISAASLPVGAPLMLASAEPDMMRSGLNDQLYQIDYML